MEGMFSEVVFRIFKGLVIMVFGGLEKDFREI